MANRFSPIRQRRIWPCSQKMQTQMLKKCWNIWECQRKNGDKNKLFSQLEKRQNIQLFHHLLIIKHWNNSSIWKAWSPRRRSKLYLLTAPILRKPNACSRLLTPRSFLPQKLLLNTLVWLISSPYSLRASLQCQLCSRQPLESCPSIIRLQVQVLSIQIKSKLLFLWPRTMAIMDKTALIWEICSDLVSSTPAWSSWKIPCFICQKLSQFHLLSWLDLELELFHLLALRKLLKQHLTRAILCFTLAAEKRIQTSFLKRNWWMPRSKDTSKNWKLQRADLKTEMECMYKTSWLLTKTKSWLCWRRRLSSVFAATPKWAKTCRSSSKNGLETTNSKKWRKIKGSLKNYGVIEINNDKNKSIN